MRNFRFGFGFFVLSAVVCMWSTTILLMAMFFLRTCEWVPEAMMLSYLGYASVVGIFAVGIIKEARLNRN